jgi:hypothetical protein
VQVRLVLTVAAAKATGEAAPSPAAAAQQAETNARGLGEIGYKSGREVND